MSLMRWDPFGEMTSLQQAMNQLLQNSVVVPRSGPGGGAFEVALDVFEAENAYRVKASLPGMKPEDVQITLQHNVLTIAGELGENREQTQGRYHLAERRTGRFSRSIALPVDVDADGAEAVFEHGVLTLTLPKAEQARRKQIPIRGQASAVIEGEQAQQHTNGGPGTKPARQSNGQREPATAGGH